MGTFGTGPLDNDTALDFKDGLIGLTSPEERYKVIVSGLSDLIACDPIDDVYADSVIETGLGACAVVADKARESYFYLLPAEDDEDLSLEMLPVVNDSLRQLAIKAARRALGVAKHPALTGWPTNEAEQSHISELGQLIRRLAR